MTFRASRWSLVCVVTLCFVAFTQPSHGQRKNRVPAQEDSSDQVDPVGLAALLLRDGHPDRAAAILSDVDLSKVEDSFDVARFHMLYAIVALKVQDRELARRRAELSIAAGQADPMIHVFHSQALFALGKHEEAIAAMDRAKDTAYRYAGTFMLRAQSYWKIGRKSEAHAALSAGLRVYPSDIELARNRVLLLVDMGLYRQAVEEGSVLLRSSQATQEDQVAFSEALIKGGQHQEAILLLEEGRFRWPSSPALTAQLGRAYLEAGHTIIAARLLREASRVDPTLTLDAAELYRRGGRLAQALHLNANVVDQKDKLRQRLGLLIELERFEEVAGLTPRLERLGLLSEDPVLYAVAYAFFKTGDFSSAERHLKPISDPALFERAAALRRAMDTCAAAGWQCQ